MDTEDIKKIARLREYIILEYRKLVIGPESPTAVMKQSDAGITLETVINSIDDIIRPYVNFEK